MDGENLGRELLNTLGLGMERAEELMDKLLDLEVKHRSNPHNGSFSRKKGRENRQKLRKEL